MSKVFVLAPIPRFDVRPAKAHGDVVYLFSSVSEINPFNGQAALNLIAESLDKLGYKPDRDMLVLTGPVASVAMLLLAASEMSDAGEIQVLIFDARNGGSYRARTISPGAIV